MLDLKPWLLNITKEFPVPQDQFYETFVKFAVEEHRLKSRENGFIDDKLV